MSKAEAPPTSDPTISLLAYLCVKDMETLSDQVVLLDRLGLTTAQIATVCGVVESSVRKSRSDAKKTKRPSRRSAAHQKEVVPHAQS